MTILFDEWKYDRVIDTHKRITKRLKNRITREYKKAISSNSENGSEARKDIVPGITHQAGTSSNFQIKWDMYIEDVIRLFDYAELKQKLKISLE